MRIIELLEDRRDFLSGRYLPLITKKASQLRIPDSVRRQIETSSGEDLPNKIFSWLESRDPTKNKQYLQWILGCAVDRSVPFEDLEYLPDILQKYDERKRKNQLPAEARDINRIKTPSELDRLLGGVTDSERTADEAEQQAALKQSKVLYRDANWLLLTPKTEQAAKYWGRDTEWCTAWGDPKGRHPTRRCNYNEYSRQGPLIIAINQHNPTERYQFHQEEEQYMDRNDAAMDEPALRQLASRWTQAMIRVIGVYIPDAFFQFIKNPPPEVQLAAVQQNGRAIRYINDPPPEVQLAAVQQDGYVIRYIKNPSPELQLAAVQQNGGAIGIIDDPSPELQLAAVKKDGGAIQFINDPGEAVQLAAVENNGGAIEYIYNPTPQVIELARKKGYDRSGRKIAT